MVHQVMEKLVRIDFGKKEQKFLNKQIRREKAQAKIEEFLIKLSKEHKPVKADLKRILQKVELNANYLELTVPIQEIKYQKVYRNYEVY